MGQFTLTGFADEIAVDLTGQLDSLKKLGLGYIEMRLVDGRNVIEFSLEEVRGMKRRLDANGVKVSAVGSPIGKVPVDEPFEPYLEAFRHTLDVAETLGTEYVRLFSFFLPKGSDPYIYREEVVARMRAFVREAERRGLILLHENEADIYGERADCCADLFASIPSDNFKAIFDPANFVVAGEEVYPRAYSLLKDNIRYLHIKDAVKTGGSHEIKPAGEGEGRLFELLSALKMEGFTGFLSVEPHLHNVYGQMDIFSAYRLALEKGEPTDSFVKDGYTQFKRALDALTGLLGRLG